MNHVHLIGIGGVGMSGLAQVLLSRGVRVSGSDPSRNEATERLESQGAVIYREQSASNIEREKPDYVIFTAAVPEDNPELSAARRAGIQVEGRADFLGRLMDEFTGPKIGVAGTHGKTTATAMVGEVLIAGGLDPTILVGGEYGPFGGNVRQGKSDVFLAEACEAYDSFLSLHPNLVIVTNVEADHLDHYGSEAGVFSAFKSFLLGLPHGATVAMCADDPGCSKVASDLAGSDLKFVRYGIEAADLDFRARRIESAGSINRFEVLRQSGEGGAPLGEVALSVPGAHNVLNALGAIAIGMAVGVPFEKAVEGVERFCGAGRRFEKLGERGGVLVVDDYAHHPTEIRATLSAARQAFPDRRLVAVFQPHLYSRTRDFMGQFAEELSKADAVLLTDIYPAREAPIEGVRVADMTKLIADRAPDMSLLYLPKKQDLVGAIEWVARPGDVVLTMGAGDIRTVGESFLAA